MADTDKELAIKWADHIVAEPFCRSAEVMAAARYILATLSAPVEGTAAWHEQWRKDVRDLQDGVAERDARIEALVSQLQNEEDDHRKDVARLTKEPAPHSGDEELRRAMTALCRQNYSADINMQLEWVERVERAVELLAKRALGEQ